MRRFIVYFLLMVTAFPSEACLCGQILKFKSFHKEAFESSQVVFIGEVIASTYDSTKEYKFNDSTYTIEVLEAFKGTTVGQLISNKITSSCDIYPGKGLWLIYGSMENGYLIMSECDPSRPLMTPEKLIYHKYTPRPPAADQKIDIDFIVHLARELSMIKLRAAIDLEKEIRWLRSKVK